MKKQHNLWLRLAWIVVIVAASFLRFDHLSDRPFHFDEATGARITAQRISPHSDYSFNPVHNHGPLLSAAASPICALVGESSWKQLTQFTLRLVPAIAGTLLVLVPLLWRRRFGDIPVLAAAALLATSPLLVYFSRMFIHEMLLTLCGLTALVILGRKTKKSKPVMLGVVVGLMFATKESFAISILSWAAAGLLVAISFRKQIITQYWRASLKSIWVDSWKPIASFLVAAALTAGFFYTDGFTHLSGAWDAVRTFFIYKTGAGHDKAFTYYIDMLAIPTKAGIWWYETPILILAVISFTLTFFQKKKRKQQPPTEILIIRFLGFTITFHILIYSLIAYKTPWLMCLPWAYTCLLAGLCFRQFPQWKAPVKVTLGVIFLGVLFQQTRTARYATDRFASDARNPYAYAPTSRNAESIQQWLSQLSEELPPGALEPIGVVGTEYWPLPWYLRDFHSIGYWRTADPALSQCPVVLAMPEQVDAMNAQLNKTHIARLKSLRANVPVMLYLRRDHWDHWMSPEESTSP